MSESTPSRCVIGGDLGGTRFRVALADETGKLLQRRSWLTEADRGLAAVLERVQALIAEVAATSPGSVAGIAIAAPGPLDPWKGIVYRPPNLPGWDEVHLKEILEARFGIPVSVGNDANLAALAEWRFGAGRGSDYVTYVTVSTGVGGGVIDRGQLLLGSGGGAAEVGHMTIELNGPYCNCGNRGCLEALASGTAISRRAVERLEAGAQSSILSLAGGRLEVVTAELVVEAAHQGDAVAREVMWNAGYALGVGLANLMHLYDPQIIVLGGGVTNAGPLLFDPMHQAIQERAMAAFRRRTRITIAELGDDVGLYGAVALALMQS